MANRKPKDEEAEDSPGIGHNNTLSTKELKNLVERIESIVGERKGLNEDIKEIMNEAKSKGYDKRTIRDVIKFRATDEDARRERQDLLDMYLNALGLL